MSEVGDSAGGRRARVWLRRWLTVAVVLVLVFAARRVAADFPALGVHPPLSGEDSAYRLHRVLAYAHIVPATLYLLLGAVQLNARVRRRHLVLHRRLGRVTVVCGLLAGAFAIVFGVLWPFGGLAETGATVVFGCYFVVALVRAVVCVRRRDVAAHRRWMIRAYATGSAVGTIRALLAVLVLPLGFRHAFAVAFWIAFVVHACAAEYWLGRGRSPRAGVPTGPRG